MLAQTKHETEAKQCAAQSLMAATNHDKWSMEGLTALKEATRGFLGQLEDVIALERDRSGLQEGLTRTKQELAAARQKSAEADVAADAALQSIVTSRCKNGWPNAVSRDITARVARWIRRSNRRMMCLACRELRSAIIAGDGSRVFPSGELPSGLHQ